MELEKLYELATGEKALYRKGASDYHTLRYVRWLESRFDDLSQNLPKANSNAVLAEVREIAYKHLAPEQVNQERIKIMDELDKSVPSDKITFKEEVLTVEPLSSHAVLADVRAELIKELLTTFEDLLEEAKSYYHLYPNSHRKTVEEYFKQEIELQKKIKKYLSNR